MALYGRSAVVWCRVAVVFSWEIDGEECSFICSGPFEVKARGVIAEERRARQTVLSSVAVLKLWLSLP